MAAGGDAFHEWTRWDGVELDDMVSAVSGGSAESLHRAAAVFDGARGLLVEAADRTRQALDILLDSADCPGMEARCRAIAAMAVWLDRLIVGSTAFGTATRTVAHGFEHVVSTIERIRPGPAPTSFRHPDIELTWVDRPPLAEYETSVRAATTDVRAAMTSYQSNTSAALRDLPGCHPVPGPDDAAADDGATGGIADDVTVPLCAVPPAFDVGDPSRRTPLVIDE
jgi:hypothetical protein